VQFTDVDWVRAIRHGVSHDRHRIQSAHATHHCEPDEVIPLRHETQPSQQRPQAKDRPAEHRVDQKRRRNDKEDAQDGHKTGEHQPCARWPAATPTQIATKLSSVPAGPVTCERTRVVLSCVYRPLLYGVVSSSTGRAFNG
jgi:hypothetical protein